MDISTLIVVVTGVGAVGALYAGLRAPRSATPIPPPPVDPVADDEYGLAPAPSPHAGDPGWSSVTRERGPASAVDSERPLQAAPAAARSKSSLALRGLRWDQSGLRDLVAGLVLLAMSAAPLVFITKPLIGVPIAGALAWIGVIFIRRGGARQHGISVERRARRSLKLPAGWTIDEGVPVRGRGDADLILTDPAGERFVVEIKAQEAIRIRKAWFSSAIEVRGADGRKLPRDPLSQVVALAGILHGYPVLWFPNAATSSIVRVGRPEVLIVQGNWRQLRKAIGAGGGWFF